MTETLRKMKKWKKVIKTKKYSRQESRTNKTKKNQNKPKHPKKPSNPEKKEVGFFYICKLVFLVFKLETSICTTKLKQLKKPPLPPLTINSTIK